MNEQPRYTFTVFTPTYNRASTLPRVKASLEAQTFRDFEWLIVDDGSTDGTDELVAEWIESSPLTIRYTYQENAGMHVAMNRGVREARGDLFLKIDSDDECVPQALERFQQHWLSIPPAERPAFSAVTALAMDKDGEVVGDLFPSDPYDSDPLHKYFDSVGRGDKWGFHRTNVLRCFPFPEPAGVEEMVPPSIVWFAIGERYKTRYVNDPLLVIHYDAEGGRMSRLTSRNTPGRRVFHEQVITKYIGFMASSPSLVVKSGINYCRYSFHAGVGPIGQLAHVEPVASKFLVAACMLPGAVAFVRDTIGFKRETRS